MTALNKEVNGSESEEASDSGSSSSSESSSFGMQTNTKGGAGAKKRPKSKAKAASSAPAKKQKVPDREDKKAQKAIEKEEAKFEAVLTSHKKVSDLLSEVKPHMVWKSLVRSAEVDRRLSKAAVTMEELQKIQSNPKLPEDQAKRANDLEMVISDQIDWVKGMRDLCKLIRTSDPEALATIIYDTTLLDLLSHCAGHLFKELDTLGDMVYALAKKLFEAFGHRFICEVSSES